MVAAKICQESPDDFALYPSPPPLDYNGWDWVPVVNDVRQFIRGSQKATTASQKPDFDAQQESMQTWYDCGYGQCHYAESVEYTPDTPVGGPMPDVPLVDEYSEGMGEATNAVVNLAQMVIVGAIMRYDLLEPKIDTPRFGIRIAPFGNPRNPTNPNLVSELPHFHFRIGPRLGESYPGLGWKHHHPWDDIGRFIKFLSSTRK